MVNISSFPLTLSPWKSWCQTVIHACSALTLNSRNIFLNDKLNNKQKGGHWKHGSRQHFPVSHPCPGPVSEQEKFDWCGRSAWTRGEPGPASKRSPRSEQLPSLLWEASAQLAGISQHSLKNLLSLDTMIAGKTYTEWKCTTGHWRTAIVSPHHREDAFCSALFINIRWRKQSTAKLQVMWDKHGGLCSAQQSSHSIKGRHLTHVPSKSAALTSADEEDKIFLPH